jgi:hypothetical protein
MAGDAGRSVQRLKARAAQVLFPGPCRGRASKTSKKISQKRALGSFMRGCPVNLPEPGSAGLTIMGVRAATPEDESLSG